MQESPNGSGFPMMKDLLGVRHNVVYSDQTKWQHSMAAGTPECMFKLSKQAQFLQMLYHTPTAD